MPRKRQVAPTSEGLSDRVFSELVARARARGGRVHPLHVGDTWLDPPAEARLDALPTAPRLYNYAPVQGEPELLDAVVEHLSARGGAPVDRECIQVMSGGTGGLSIVCQTLLGHGDEVIVPAPFWPLIRGIIASRGARAVEVPLWTRLDEPGFDVEQALEAAITDRTVALYLNTPNNPTGRVLGPDQVTAFARVAERHDLWVISDEAYEELHFGGRPAPAWAHQAMRARTVATHTLSKGYAYAGARVGFTHGPPEAMRAIRAVQTFQAYCAARPSQLGAARALCRGGAWLADARRTYEQAGRLAAAALGLPAPEGGTFLFFDAAPYLGQDEHDCVPFLERCLEVGVLLTPGSACGRDYGRWVRLCFTSVPPAELADALERLSKVTGRR
jgi:N-succinyldiaminopimelate aminotransferase